MEDFDIWDVKCVVQEGGYFQVVQKTKEHFNKVVLRDKEGKANRRVLKKRMSNYFSFGVDARIGFGFDKGRTGSALCNKCVYCWEGFKKMFIRTRRINEVIENFGPLHERVLRRSVADVESLQDDAEHRVQKMGHQITGSPATLVCLNIDSYSGGVRDIWRNAEGSNFERLTSGSCFSDGYLEFLTFDSILGIANERYRMKKQHDSLRFLGGSAKRVA